MKLTHLQEARHHNAVDMGSVCFVSIVHTNMGDGAAASMVGPFRDRHQAEEFVEALEDKFESKGKDPYGVDEGDGYFEEIDVEYATDPQDYLSEFD